MSQSQAIVQFIGNLLPLYTQEEIDGVWCARSLTDGTVVMPVAADEEAGDEDGFVELRWQGDANRKTIVQGVFFATNALVQYVQLHRVGATAQQTKMMLEDLAHHFTIKTGAALYLDSVKTDTADLLRKAIAKVGESVVTEAIKKTIGR